MDGTSPAFRLTAGLYGLGTAMHAVDHFRRGIDAVTEHVLWLGSAASVAAFFVVALALGAHRLAPLAAATFAIPHALGIAAVHYLPRWSTALSDAFPGTAVHPLSWIAVTLEVAGAIAFGLTGLAILRRWRPATHAAVGAG